ncbi:hypothetical protein NA57DRAFT_38690 [Rhizodiscina lignyota]|uniref:Phosphatidate cytidylyltransferase n=1 Tax=Rhizodiscina lignyota TaxID=1504668 RepID=A0A9P4IF77_9PEZI|nr:hypothetical protein NA57DRAFT_38690 [Rhizodiscina lignyota]
MASHYPIPTTPRVISPSPTPSETSGTTSRDGYFGPITRSITRTSRAKSPPPIAEDQDNESSGSDRDPEKRARTRSRSPIVEAGTKRRMSGLTAINPKSSIPSAAGKPVRRKVDTELANGTANGTANGHLSPQSANGGRWTWRELSRSPSPLGLIPIHTKWRTFIHKHEIPRKLLHVSIGFLTLYLYYAGVQPDQIHPILLYIFLPIAAIDVARHNSPALNRQYIRVVGALMRESEVDGWNGTLSYLLGAWTVLRFCPKDVGVMGVLILSWCDTAASTFGRLWGRYTPLIRKGKSLAGSLAAMIVGIGTAVMFWGVLAPRISPLGYDTGENSFAFQGHLSLPESITTELGISREQATITGGLALVAMGLWTGFVGAASEAIDLFGWDDNLTIPLLCGAGLWGFLKIFT